MKDLFKSLLSSKIGSFSEFIRNDAIIWKSWVFSIMDDKDFSSGICFYSNSLDEEGSYYSSINGPETPNTRRQHFI